VVLKRFGRLSTAHVAIFEVETALDAVTRSYISLLGNTYASQSPKTYSNSSANLNNPPNLGRIFGILKADGSIYLAYLDYSSSADNGVLLLGKFELTRSNLLELNEVAVESIPATASNLALYDTASINGKDVQAAATLVLVENGNYIHTYKCKIAAKNHIIVFTGSFNLTTVEITGVQGSRR